MSLVKEVEVLMEILKDQVTGVIFAGHSLGGTAAFCLAGRYSQSRAVCFNMGASPTNPITVGPGASRANVYHIVGDVVSTHISDAAAAVYRVKIQGVGWGSLEAHSTSLLYRGRSWKYISAKEEDSEFVDWLKRDTVIRSGFFFANYFNVIKRDGANEPIPGVERS